MFETAGQVIKYVTVPQNSGTSLICDVSTNKIVVISAKYYSTTVPVFQDVNWT